MFQNNFAVKKSFWRALGLIFFFFFAKTSETKLITVASDEANKILFVRHVTKVKPKTSGNSITDLIPFFTFEYLNTFFNFSHIFTLLLLYIQSILSCNSNSIMMTWSHRNVVLFILYRSCLS